MTLEHIALAFAITVIIAGIFLALAIVRLGRKADVTMAKLICQDCDQFDGIDEKYDLIICKKYGKLLPYEIAYLPENKLETDEDVKAEA